MIKIANCPDSWGVLFPEDEKQIGWERFADEFCRAGYRYLELGPYGYWPTDLSLRQEFDRRGIVCISGAIGGHFEESMDVWNEQIREKCPYYKALGCEYVVLAGGRYNDRVTRRFTHPRYLPEKDWDLFIAHVNEIAHIIAEEYGMSVVYHPHADTHIEQEFQIERFLLETDPKEVNLCFDTGHHIISGGEPVSFVRNFGDRITFLHVKNVNGALKNAVIEKRLGNLESLEAGIYTRLDQGEMDFRELKAALEKWSFDGYAVIEQDVYPIDLTAAEDDYNGPLTVQTKNAEYLEEIGFGMR